MLQVQAGYSGDQGPSWRCTLWILWGGFGRHLAPAGTESRSRSIESLPGGWAAGERLLLAGAQSTHTRVPVRGYPGSGECRLWLFSGSRALAWSVFLPRSGLAAAAPSRAWIGDWPLRSPWEKGPSLVLGAIKVQKCDPHRRRSGRLKY